MKDYFHEMNYSTMFADYSTSFFDSNRLFHATAEADSFNELQHAIADAELVLLNMQTELNGDLPWQSNESHFVIPGPFKESSCFYYSFSDDECFSVTSDELLTLDQIRDNWTEVDAADRKEVASFVQHSVFALSKRSDSRNTVDGVWVRKWLNRKLGTVKSRCCGRGFLDKQKLCIDRHSSTASRLSHRICCSLAVQFDLTIECFDITTAFLQGLKFSEVESKARELGIETKEARAVWFKPPANVWRHLRQNQNSTIYVEDCDIDLFILRCLKALYGLVDGPLLWQLALLYFLKWEGGMEVSLYDENFLFIVDSFSQLICICTVHVDDLLVAATYEMLAWLAEIIEKKFGKPKRNSIPFVHLGVRHEYLADDHLYINQTHYPEKIKPAVASSKELYQKELLPLDVAEHHSYRSTLCSILWICNTTPTASHKVVALQAHMVTPMMSHLRDVNSLLKKLLKDKTMCGIHFHKLPWPVRIVAVSDAGHATKLSVYPFEGRFVLMMHDPINKYRDMEWLDTHASTMLGGYAHNHYHSGKKASRVSHSTSHAETLSFVGCGGVAQLCAARISEIWMAEYLSVPRHTLTARDLYGAGYFVLIPVDQVTDCMDLFELITNTKGLTTDKAQRIAIMAIREDRFHGRIRGIFHIPTGMMLADGLTKDGQFDLLNLFCTTGRWKITLKDEQYMRIRVRRKTKSVCTELELENLDW